MTPNEDQAKKEKELIKSLKPGENPPAGAKEIVVTFSVHKTVSVPANWNPQDFAGALRRGEIPLLDEPQALELVGDQADSVWSFDVGDLSYDEDGTCMNPPEDPIEDMHRRMEENGGRIMADLKRYVDYATEHEPRERFKQEHLPELAAVVVAFGAKHNLSDQTLVEYLKQLANNIEKSQEVL